MNGLIQVTATKGRKTISDEVYGNLLEVDILKGRLMNRNKILHSDRSSWKLDSVKMNKEIEEIKPYSTKPAPFKFRDYQLDIIDRGCEIIKNKGFVYLAMEVRTGKTLTSLGIANKLDCSSVLFLTKKKAISSIEKDFKVLRASYNLLVVNYESIHKIPDTKWDLIVCDESHSCFLENTLIGGAKIKDIELGSFQKSFNFAKGIYEYKKVLNVFKNQLTENLIKIKCNGKEIVCTESHKIFTKRGWVKAGELLPTDELQVL